MNRKQKIIQIQQRRATRKALGIKLPSRRKRVPRQIHPVGIEQGYFWAIMRLIGPYFDEVTSLLVTRLPEVIKSKFEASRIDSRGILKMDATHAEMISEMFADIEVAVGYKITDTAIRETAETYAGRTNAFNKLQVDKQFRSVLGIEVLRQEKWLAPQISSFVEMNTALIKDITAKSAREMHQLVMTRVEAGDSLRTIKNAIREKLDVTERRAKMIARDQVSKFTGKLTELRQREAGVEEYIWRDAGDNAVRAKHRFNNNKRFRWDQPPPTGHPGQDYQCRCTAEPVMDEFLEVAA